MEKLNQLYSFLETLYYKYNYPKYIDPDPLIFPRKYKNPYDIDIMAFISSSLAFGNVKQIMSHLEIVEKNLKYKPYEYLSNASITDIKQDFKNFRYRFINGEIFSRYLISLKKIVKNYKSPIILFYKLYENINSINSPQNQKILYAYKEFYSYFKNPKYLLASPYLRSAMKKFFLYLRWVVRNDNVDLGVLEKLGLDALKIRQDLIIPLDTHMLSIGKLFAKYYLDVFPDFSIIINSNNSTIKYAIILSNFFRLLNPDDPIKYDFVLTRFGIKFKKKENLNNMLINIAKIKNIANIKNI